MSIPSDKERAMATFEFIIEHILRENKDVTLTEILHDFGKSLNDMTTGSIVTKRLAETWCPMRFFSGVDIELSKYIDDELHSLLDNKIREWKNSMGYPLED